MIVIDRRVDEAGAAVLCKNHADRVTVPKGWTLDDQRDDHPRLFGVGRFNEPKRPLERLRRLPESIAAAVAQLPLENATPYDMPAGYETAGATPASRQSLDKPDQASVTDQALARARVREQHGTDAQLYVNGVTPGPLLMRAFDAARSRVRTTSHLASLIPPGDEPLVVGAGA